jgi:4-amino-4-deoxy-L-arabinose transferase-like glycosyltransferase
MRAPILQYFYLQKPITLAVIIAALSVLPWIGLGGFSTKGEPREAAVAVSMLETGDWVLPKVYADEFAYKPPLAHWLMAACSLPQGHVSEFTARLPSALAYIILIGATLFFFGERLIKFQEAFVAALLLLTCFEIHRAGMAARVDMLLTMFVVCGLYVLYWWENRLHLKGLPLPIPLLLGCATLTKGPVGIVLPLFAFGVYLLVLGKYRKRKIFKSLLYVGIASLFLPAIWYVAAWQQGGNAFLHRVLAENFDRFFHLQNASIGYDLGHENGVWYNFVTLMSGFLPWTLLLFFSLFGLKRKELSPIKSWLKGFMARLRSMEKVKLFSLCMAVCILFFYCLPSSKRSVYLMPAYPFIALFIAQYVLYLATYKKWVIRVFAGLLAFVAICVLALSGLLLSGVIDLPSLEARMNMGGMLPYDTEGIARLFASPDACLIGILIFCLLVLAVLFYQIRKKINLKILYASVALVFALNLFIDGVAMRGVRQAGCIKPFAEHIREKYGLNGSNTYVMNDLREYKNLYGLNFYLDGRLHNFAKEQPSSGYFLVGEQDAAKVLARYGRYYAFYPLETTPSPAADVRQKICLYRVCKKTQAGTSIQ